MCVRGGAHMERLLMSHGYTKYMELMMSNTMNYYILKIINL